MVKLFFLNLWSNLKRSPVVSLLIFVQIAVLSYSLMNILFEKTSSDFTNEAYEGVYLENTLFNIRPFYLDREENARASAGMFESVENSGLDDYEAFHELIMASEDIKTAVMTGTGTDSDYYSVDRDYLDIFGFIMDSGRVFDDDEFDNIDFNRVPVILGYDYKDEYSIGDTFEAPHIALGYKDSANCTYEVIGFIAKGQIYFDPGGSGPFLFDKKMILPYYTKTLSEWMDFYEENEEYLRKKTVIRYYIAGLGANMISGRHYLIESGKEEVLLDYMNNALSETGLNKFYKIGSSFRSAVLQTGDEIFEKNAVYTVLTLIMIIFVLVSVIFSSVNNVSNNMKTYAVHNLVGATRTRIITYAVAEVFAYCVLGFAAGFLWTYVFDYVMMRATEHPALPSAVLALAAIAATFTVLACALSFVFVRIRVKNYSTSELIRGREVKKNKRQPFYKVMYFTMMALVGVSVTFLSSYSYQVEHIDKYQNNYLPKSGTVLYLNRLPGNDPPIVKLYYDIDEFTNYSVDMLIESNYDELSNPKVRGWFYKGDFGVPEITEGRFFTPDEISKVTNYAVVGKNAFADFGTERDGKRYITYKDSEFEVIGIVGREGHETTVDDWVFITLPTVLSNYGIEGRPVIIDAETETLQTQIIEYIRSSADGRYTLMEQPIQARIDIGISDFVIYLFILMVFITAVVFCVYFTDKIIRIINVKKFLGYSKGMIFADTAGQFILLSVIAYILGNGIMLALSKTALKDVTLFSVFSVNLPVLSFSLGALLLIAFLFSLLAIYRSFRGTARDLRRG